MKVSEPKNYDKVLKITDTFNIRYLYHSWVNYNLNILLHLQQYSFLTLFKGPHHIKFLNQYGPSAVKQTSSWYPIRRQEGWLMSLPSSARIRTTSALVLPTVYYLHYNNILKLYPGLDHTMLAVYQRHNFAPNLSRCNQ